MQHFLARLDGEVHLLECLVTTTQQEHQHILAFDPEPLAEVTERKRQLIQRLDEMRNHRERVVGDMLRSNGVSTDANRLSDLIPIIPEGSRAPLQVRRMRLLALMATLKELSEATRYYARRQLRWIRSQRKALAGADARNEELYGPDGEQPVAIAGGRRLAMRA
jgi:flagellar biosynthesis/type III secretory pathway chaperone